eukprot:g10419.t1
MLITDAALAHLSALPLHFLELGACERITDTGLAHLAALPLQRLNLSDCKQVTDAGLAHLSALPLQSLNLSGCANVTDAGLALVCTSPSISASRSLQNHRRWAGSLGCCAARVQSQWSPPPRANRATESSLRAALKVRANINHNRGALIFFECGDNPVSGADVLSASQSAALRVRPAPAESDAVCSLNGSAATP